MLMAYTPDERYRLIDLIMEKFREVFGCLPKSVGSWLIDSRSVEYMSEKYQLDAVCVCKEQYGTDGYTLWGGYYNQGYYPSKKNMFLPAQTKGEQVSTPVFKMLGPDPIYQYDDGFDEHYNPSALQHVMTLEPTWGAGESRLGRLVFRHDIRKRVARLCLLSDRTGEFVHVEEYRARAENAVRKADGFGSTPAKLM